MILRERNVLRGRNDSPLISVFPLSWLNLYQSFSAGGVFLRIVCTMGRFLRLEYTGSLDPWLRSETVFEAVFPPPVRARKDTATLI
jgi:hypothetical protein